MSRKRVWIVDGHNVIFAIHELKELQVGGRGDEARQALCERLEGFARQRQQRVVVVFDSGAAASGRGGARGAHFEIVYAAGGAGAADRHIVREAERRAGEGLPVAVVTDDVRTLASRLPRGVRHFAVREFWLTEVEPRPAADDKPVSGDFADLEREMLVQAAKSERLAAVAEPTQRGFDPPPVSHARVDAAAERLRSKRARGRLRQERRLEQRRGGRAGRAR